MRGVGGCTTTHSSTEGRALRPLINEVMAKNAVRTVQDADKRFSSDRLTSPDSDCDGTAWKKQSSRPKRISQIFRSWTHTVNVKKKEKKKDETQPKFNII